MGFQIYRINLQLGTERISALAGVAYPHDQDAQMVQSAAASYCFDKVLEVMPK